MISKILKAIFLLLIIGIALNLILYFLPYVFPAIGTRYSKGFNSDVFESIKVGENKSRVDSLLGKPLFIKEDDSGTDSVKIHYWYSKDNSPLFFYDRIEIIFFKNKVYGKERFLAP